MATFGDGLRKEGREGVILTRAVWAGAARLGVVLWSSDIWSTFEELTAQVPEGVAASVRQTDRQTLVLLDIQHTTHTHVHAHAEGQREAIHPLCSRLF
jgi:hypothetical protein